MRYEAPEPKQKNRKHRHNHPFFTLVLLLLALVIGYKLISQRLYHTGVISRQQAQISETDTQTNTPPPAEQQWIHYTIKTGDSMAKIFNRLSLDPQDLHALMKMGDDTEALGKLNAGQKIDLLISDKPEPNSQYKQLRALHLKLNARDTLVIKYDGEKYSTEFFEKPIETQTEIATATINNSFLGAGNKANIPDAVLRQVMSLFSWRIDFRRDVRKNDSFTVSYEDQYLDGKKVKTGEIIAAEFVNKGVAYYAIRYKNKNGDVSYYSSTGASVHKAFLRRPVNSGHISSPFNMNRRHPILGYARPHTGTDFAASYGTPIHATGDGRVMFLGRKGGYGRAIILRHGSRIETLYAHMSRYAQGLKQGQYVKQGQTIGYIGTSGLSTGPHVHYEFRINNKYYDPMRVRLPDAAPIPKNERAKYITYADQEVQKLNDYRQKYTPKIMASANNSNLK